MKPKSIPLLLPALMLLIAGCSGATGESISSSFPAMARSAPREATENLPGQGMLPSSAIPIDQDSASEERLIVQNVSMTLLVNSITEAIDNISSLAAEMKGFVVSSHISGDEGVKYGFTSFRVPADRISDVRSHLREIAVRVREESSQTMDVTEEYVDLQGRLKNLERTEDQYILLLSRAESVEDMLKVQKELSNVQGQIEQATGRILYLQRTSAMSLISVNLHMATSVEPLLSPGWSFQETVKDALRSMARFSQWLAGTVIWIVIHFPMWGPLLVVTYFVARWLLRRIR